MDGEIVLDGATVRVEPLRADHVAALLAAASEDRRSYTLTTVPQDLDHMTAYVETALAEAAAGLCVPFVIVRRADGLVVGTTRFCDLTFWPIPGGPDPRRAPSTAEIGYTWLAASAQRTAVNTETKLLLLRHAFETWGVCRVCLKTDVRNDRSRAAIARIGAQFEGVRRAHMPAADGGIRDSAYYSITADEWPAVRTALEARLAAVRGSASRPA